MVSSKEKKMVEQLRTSGWVIYKPSAARSGQLYNGDLRDHVKFILGCKRAGRSKGEIAKLLIEKIGEDANCSRTVELRSQQINYILIRYGVHHPIKEEIRKAKSKARREQILMMKDSGKTYLEIGRTIGISVGRVGELLRVARGR
jgi:hypothetical protein